VVLSFRLPNTGGDLKRGYAVLSRVILSRLVSRLVSRVSARIRAGGRG
jgi:hypothetical protein